MPRPICVTKSRRISSIRRNKRISSADQWHGHLAASDRRLRWLKARIGRNNSSRQVFIIISRPSGVPMAAIDRSSYAPGRCLLNEGESIHWAAPKRPANEDDCGVISESAFSDKLVRSRVKRPWWSAAHEKKTNLFSDRIHRRQHFLSDS
jgi:hypothetical protein